MKNFNKKTSYSSCKPGFQGLIKCALAGLALTSGVATAALMDHGPSDRTLTWPLWYRDLNGLPLGLCRSQAPSPNVGAAGAPMCFPIATNPRGFPGNIGDEIFYTNLNADITNGGINLRYVTGLEAAYGNAAGTPVVGNEVVFARVRFVMGVNTPTCVGDYRIIHPWGDQTFAVGQIGPRALFETIDIPLGAFLDFEGSLKGPLGPFLHWDGNGDEVPLDRTVPANGLIVGADQFVGDPSVLHTYTGSPFIETKPDGTPRYFLADGITPQHQNYLKVIAPAGCDIGGVPVAQGGEGINVQKEALGLLMGQVWTAPIPTPTKITQAEFSRTATATTVDVWASTGKAQNLFVSGTDLAGVQMTEVLENGLPTGRYQAHMVLPPNSTLPPSVHVINRSSVPTFVTSAPLTDVIYISKSDYNPASGNLCVWAMSSDNQALTLTVDSTPLTVQLDGTDKPGCSPVVPNPDLLTAFVPYPLNRSPDKVRVSSGLLGYAEKQVLVLPNTPDNTATLVANPDAFLNVPGAGPQVLNVGANDGSTGEIVIIDQPSITTIDATGQAVTQIVGTVTGSLTGGTVTFTGKPGAAGVATFSYVIKNGVNYSNIVNVTVDTVFVALSPTANPDNFAVLRTNNTTGFTANVLQNDVASVGTSIDPASLTITTQGTKGVATVNANGTVTYKPNVGVVAGNDVFFYTVANSAGVVTAPVRVDVVVENVPESVIISRNKITNTGGAQRYDMRFTTNWFGAPLSPTGSCWLVRVNNINIPTPRFIGSGPIDATGAVLMQIVSTKLYNAADYNPAVDIPALPAKASYTIRCGSSNLVNRLPAATATSTADNTTLAP